MRKASIVFCIILMVFCLASCQTTENENQGNTPNNTEKVNTANEIAGVINGQGTTSEESEDAVSDTTTDGVVDIDGEQCEVYVVTLKNGVKETLAVDSKGNWFIQQESGDYVPVTLSADGTIKVGNIKTEDTTAISVAKRLSEKFLFLEDLTVEKTGNGQINGQDCIIFTAKQATKDLAKLAYAENEDGTWYFQKLEQGFYRIVIRNGLDGWLGRPVDNEPIAAKWVCKKIVGAEGDLFADSLVSMNGVDATKYRYEKDKTVYAYLLVTLDGKWYYADAKENYKEVQFTDKGMVVE